MKRFYLPALALTLIIVMVLPSISVPVNATFTQDLPRRLLPTLDVKLIAEDDQVRKTGVMLLGLGVIGRDWPNDKCRDLIRQVGDDGSGGTPGTERFCADGVDFLAQYKVLVTFNGVPVNPDQGVFCEVIEKDKAQPVPKVQQFEQENLVTVLQDVSQFFVCKYREGKDGVGVLDVYFLESAAEESIIPLQEFIADNVLVVTFSAKIGGTTLYGTGVNDVCILGWSMSSNFLRISKPNGDTHDTWSDQLGPFTSCEEAALWQRAFLHIPIQTYTG